MGGHAAAAHPQRPLAVAFARRPGRFTIVLDCVQGAQLARLGAPKGRHFYGHGCFSADGALLFTTENDYDGRRGMIGVWDGADGFRRLGELPSGGVGPHDTRRMPDGGLVVANGGIKTHPDTGRTRLNLPMMRPNLSYLSEQGTILEQVEPPGDLSANSIRHLAVSNDGLVAAACQWQGPGHVHPPLLALHRRGQPLALLSAPPEQNRRMHGYAGSIALAPRADHVAITSPRGGIAQVFDINARTLIASHEHPDICGIGATDRGFVFTTGTGDVGLIPGTDGAAVRRHDLAFDNHLVAL